MATTNSTREINEMKIGDIVIVKNLPFKEPKFLKGIIIEIHYPNTILPHLEFFVDGEAMGWFFEEDLELLNCSIGRQYDRFHIMEFGDGTTQIIDNYAKKIRDSYRDGKWQ